MISPPVVEERADLGLLVVHGIGRQRRGATLAQVGGSLAAWLNDFYDGMHDAWVTSGVDVSTIDRWLGESSDSNPVREAALRALLDRVVPEPATGGQFPDQLTGARGVPGPVRSRLLRCAHALAIARWTRRRGPKDDQSPDQGPEPCSVKKLAEQRGSLLAVDTRLIVPPTGDDQVTPRHAVLSWTRLRVDGSTQRSNWVVAEAWWAETFLPPSFGELARWGLSVLPAAVASFVGKRFAAALAAVHQGWREAPLSRRLRLALAVVFSAGGLAIGAVGQLLALAVLAIMLVLRMVPLPGFQNWLSRVQQGLAGSLGDAYVLATRPVEAASIVSAVRRDLEWLAARCDWVVILAHSQGCAVTVEVLRREMGRPDGLLPTAPIKSGDLAGRESDHSAAGGTAAKAVGADRGTLVEVITYGSGLRILDAVRRLLGADRGLRSSAAWIVPGTLLIALGVLQLFLLTRVRLDEASGLWMRVGLVVYAVSLFVVGLPLVVGGFVDSVRARPSPELRWWLDRIRATGLAWVDIHASADPVPNGPLFDAQQAYPKDVAVFNERSALRDHTAYWRSRDEFIPSIMSRLSAIDPALAEDLSGTSDWFDSAGKRRRWRVAWWMLARRVAAGAAGIAVLADASWWFGWLNTGAEWVADKIPRMEYAAEAGPSGVAPAARIGLILVCLFAVRLAWSYLDRVEIETVVALRPLPIRRHPTRRSKGQPSQGDGSRVTYYPLRTLVGMITLLVGACGSIGLWAFHRFTEGASAAIFMIAILGFAGVSTWQEERSAEALHGPRHPQLRAAQTASGRTRDALRRQIVAAGNIIGIIFAAAAALAWFVIE